MSGVSGVYSLQQRRNFVFVLGFPCFTHYISFLRSEGLVYISLINESPSCIFFHELIHEKSTTVALRVCPKTAVVAP